MRRRLTIANVASPMPMGVQAYERRVIARFRPTAVSHPSEHFVRLILAQIAADAEVVDAEPLGTLRDHRAEILKTTGAAAA